MAIQTINIGNVVNDGLGDDLRTAFQKVNANFVSLNSELSVSGLNLGVGAQIFKERVGGELRFKTLVSGTKIAINSDPEETIVINNTAPDAFTKFNTDSGEVIANSPSTGNRGALTIEGDKAPGINLGIKDIVTSTDSLNHIRIKTVLPITEILTTVDFGPITGSVTNALQLAFSTANIDFGTITLPSTLSLDLGEIF